MALRDIVVIGASAGGVEALTRLTSLLPRDFPAALFMVLHLPPHGTSVMPQILNRKGTLKAIHPAHGALIQHGHIYMAAPNYHLLVKRDQVHVVHGPRENGHRPSVDPMFRTAARSYGQRVIGVVLSGSLDDGTSGALCIKERGGIVLVQDPEEALYPGMPQSAIDNVEVDAVLSLEAIAARLIELVRAEFDEEDVVAGAFEEELDVVERRSDAFENGKVPPGRLSGLTCPDCGGAVWENHEGDMIRFRCHTGHGYSAESMLAQ